MTSSKNHSELGLERSEITLHETPIPTRTVKFPMPESEDDLPLPELRYRSPSPAPSKGLSSNQVIAAQKGRKLRSLTGQYYIIGFADGMTVPFALAVGLSVVASRKALIAAGLLEILAGAVPMAAAAFIAALNEREQFTAKEKIEIERIRTEPEEAASEVVELMQGYKIDRPAVEPLLLLTLSPP